MEKKEYTKPELDVVELKHEAYLLDASVDMGMASTPKDDVAWIFFYLSVTKEETMEMEQKKAYTAPEMKVVQFERQVALLTESDPDYEGEFAHAPHQHNSLV